MNALLIQFSYLQLLDVLTTLAFLTVGVQEANPLVRFAIHATPSPAIGLLLVKVFGFALATLCWWQDRETTLRHINVAFGLLILWNLTALILAAAAAQGR